jgi:hypothetical protein
MASEGTSMKQPTHDEIEREAYSEWETAGRPEGFDPQTGMDVSVAIWLHSESLLRELMNIPLGPETRPSYVVMP